MAVYLLLTITNVDSTLGGETRRFRESPVSIGMRSVNTIQVDDPRVAGQQGLIFFTCSKVKYRACSIIGEDGLPSVVQVAPGITLRIGPLELLAGIEEAGENAPLPSNGKDGFGLLAEQVDLIFRTVALTACSIPCDDPRSKLDVAGRATRLLRAIGTMATDLRRGALAVPPPSADIGHPRPHRCDPLAITDYLLDPSGAEIRLEDLRRNLLDLARWEAVAHIPWGTA